MKKTTQVAVNIFFGAVCTFGTAALLGCSTTYNPDDFVNPNRVVEKKVEVPVLPSVNATYGIGNDPAVVKAYEQYSKTGKMSTIRSDGWITYPYSNSTKPIISCSVYHFCIVQLEAGEKLNSYGLGDTQNWVTNAFVTGAGQTASISIQMKPSLNNISTDLTISTDKRTYLVGLVSKVNVGTSVLRFYYPEETMINNLVQANKIQQNDSNNTNNTRVISSSKLADGTEVNLGKINFNYKIKGDSPAWRPLRVFDDGNKTYVEMPALASKFNLPVLYLSKDKEMQLINYRYEKPYFVVDGLFSAAWLVSGKDKEQERVEILNQNIHS